MTGNYRISWSEENSPQPFTWCWAASQSVLVLVGFLIKTRVLQSMALTQRNNPGWERAFGFFVFVLLLTTLSLYLNLVINGLWHRNPDLSLPDEDAEPSGVTSLHLEEAGPNGNQLTSPGLFDQSILKNPDPIVTRDQIQWKKIGLATVAVGTLAASFVLIQ
jgi:hypothetical protein